MCEPATDGKTLMRERKLAALAALLAASVSAAAAPPGGDRTDWPCWRGPGGDGKSPATGIKTDWSGGLTQLWERKDLCRKGRSWSAPVVKGHRLVVVGHYRLAEPVTKGYDVVRTGRGKDVVFCFHADTGEPLWTSEYDVEVTQTNHQAGSGPHGTPYVDGERVYTQGGYGHVACWRLSDGKRLWLTNVKDHGGKPPTYGYCTSPLVIGGVVVVQGGGSAQVIAFRKDTGQVAWTVGQGPASYAAPLPARIRGKLQAVVLSGNVLRGIDPGGGKVLWSVPYETKAGHNQTSPVSEGDFVLITSSYQTREKCKAIVVGAGNEPKRIWGGRVISSCQSDPIVLGGHVYTYSGGSAWTTGQFKCVERATGRERWSVPVEVNHGQAAMVHVDGYLLYKTYNGRLGLWKAGPDGARKVTEWQIPRARRKEAYTVPVVARGKLYVRDHAVLTCYDLRKRAARPMK